MRICPYIGLRDLLDSSVVSLKVFVQTLSQHPPQVLSAHPVVGDRHTSGGVDFRAIGHGHANIYLSRALE